MEEGLRRSKRLKVKAGNGANDTSSGTIAQSASPHVSSSSQGSVSSQRPASVRALELPELVAIVLYHAHSNFLSTVHDRNPNRSIFACIAVNVLWAKEGRRHLWRSCKSIDQPRYFPQIHHLLNVNVASRQSVANIIKELHFGHGSQATQMWSGHHHTSLQFMAFPQLEKLVLGSPRRGWGKDMAACRSSPLAQYIVPTLKIISFNCDRGEVSGFDLSDNLITAIADRCPLLEELSIKIISTWHNPATMSSMAFASALRKLHSLLKVELQVGIVGTISLAVLLALSEHPSLNVLKLPDMRLDYTPRTDPVNQLVHTNLRGGNIFRNLEVLQVSVSNAALSVILPYVGKLRRLELVPYPSGENLLESFDGILLPNLEEAIFDSWSDNPIPARSFDVFAKSVPNLQVLEFPTKRKGRNVHYPVANLNDAQIQRMIQNLKKIRNFSLAVQAPLLTEASIAFLGQNCQQLEHFQLMGNFAFEEVIRRSTNNCWLKLTSFDIGSIDNHRNSRVANIRRPITVARGLLRIMPKLNAAPFPAGIPIQRALRERALLAGREWN